MRASGAYPTAAVHGRAAPPATATHSVREPLQRRADRSNLVPGAQRACTPPTHVELCPRSGVNSTSTADVPRPCHPSSSRRRRVPGPRSVCGRRAPTVRPPCAGDAVSTARPPCARGNRIRPSRCKIARIATPSCQKRNEAALVGGPCRVCARGASSGRHTLREKRSPGADLSRPRRPVCRTLCARRRPRRGGGPHALRRCSSTTRPRVSDVTFRGRPRGRAARRRRERARRRTTHPPSGRRCTRSRAPNTATAPTPTRARPAGT